MCIIVRIRFGGFGDVIMHRLERGGQGEVGRGSWLQSSIARISCAGGGRLPKRNYEAMSPKSCHFPVSSAPIDWLMAHRYEADDDWRRNRKKIMKSRESGSQIGEEVLDNGGLSLFLVFRFEGFLRIFWGCFFVGIVPFMTHGQSHTSPGEEVKRKRINRSSR